MGGKYDDPAPKTDEDRAAEDAAREASIEERRKVLRERKEGEGK